jgi:hypothetical protein
MLYWLTPLLFAASFATLWSLVCVALAGSGWRQFAMRYPTQARASEPSFLARRASFGSLFASYRNIVRLSFLPDGILFGVMFPFRLGHRPFLLPWSSVESADVRKFWISNYCELKISDPAGRIVVYLAAQAEPAIRLGMASPGARSAAGAGATVRACEKSKAIG